MKMLKNEPIFSSVAVASLKIICRFNLHQALFMRSFISAEEGAMFSYGGFVRHSQRN